ncbi:liprin-beta-1-like isoform X3 [Pecten maximus]|uniref:liprin-beta-1-like isoform X3 n=1 Tax=Pecten maximus TaxID=6579 RepID=UPI00145886A6|nr:liprin-beta-1-like isoform X3 [Pecten maximus]
MDILYIFMRAHNSAGPSDTELTVSSARVYNTDVTGRQTSLPGYRGGRGTTKDSSPRISSQNGYRCDKDVEGINRERYRISGTVFVPSEEMSNGQLNRPTTSLTSRVIRRYQGAQSLNLDSTPSSPDSPGDTCGCRIPGMRSDRVHPVSGNNQSPARVSFQDPSRLTVRHNDQRSSHDQRRYRRAETVCTARPHTMADYSQYSEYLYYYQTLPRHQSRGSNSYLSENADDKVQRLETDKQSLTLQVSVLSEQVEAQSEKIRELELGLDERRDRLMQAEKMLQSELLTRTSLETHKLDMMAEISSLKIKLASSDKDRRDLDERLKISQRQIKEVESKLALRDAEITELRQRLVRNGTVLTPDSNGAESLLNVSDRPVEKEKTLDRLKRKQYEVEKLKKAVDALMYSNQEKDKRIEELRKLLKRYRKIEEMVIQAQGRKALEDMIINAEDDTSSTSSTTPSVSDSVPRDQHDGYDRHHPSATSTPVHSHLDNGNHTPSPSSNMSTPSHRTTGLQRSNSAEDVTPTNQKKKTVSNNNHQEGYSNGSNNNSFGTLPKDRVQSADLDHTEVRKSRGFPSLGKSLFRVKTGKRSTSAPNLAHTEVVTDDEDGLQHVGMASDIPSEVKKKKGLKRFFGKLKRSGSQDFHERERVEQFRRGGVRATASGRIGWSKELKYNDDLPFSRWDSERVTAWMNDIGLNMYLVECRRWVKNGEQLQRASAHELEKDMGVKNCLHRKKLQLALQAITANSKDQLSILDHNWVTRWLDDIGLPQYKDVFYDARVDGRMLHFLTVDDLLALKVTSELHHISIKRGIQVLRSNNYNPQCLRRRPSPDEGQLQNIPGGVVLWTNHRVMEWLRTIDLSEYAPNLRGSGVHGALMVLEPRFNAELFSQLLSIPTNKTLLRRHLNTHFVALIGNEVQIKKREAESLPGFIPLVLNAKVKNRKFGLFGHKRSKSDAEVDSFICPMDNGFSNGMTRRDKEKAEKAAKEIGAFSKEINSLTNMLQSDLDDVPTSTV